MNTPDYNELAVRCARLEIERDDLRQRLAVLSEAHYALTANDTEKMLNTLHIIGIPARDLHDIYEIAGEWNRAGGNDNWLNDWRTERRMRMRPDPGKPSGY